MVRLVGLRCDGGSVDVAGLAWAQEPAHLEQPPPVAEDAQVPESRPVQQPGFACAPNGPAWGADYVEKKAVRCWLGDTLTATLAPSDHRALREATRDGVRQIALFIGGRPIPDVVGRLGSDDRVYFDLARTSDNRADWARYSPWLAYTSLVVHVGLDDGTHVAAGPGKIELRFVRPVWLGLVGVVSVALVAAFAYLAWFTPMLRDGVRNDGKPGTYSLARTQMAFWTVVVVGSYLALLGVCGTVDSLNASILALMGISGGSAVGAVAVESKTDQADATAKPSSGLIPDVLHGVTPFALHRLQFVAWTGIVGLVVVRSVVVDLQFPVLDATLLGLMGISGGAYLGIKMAEPSPRGEVEKAGP